VCAWSARYYASSERLTAFLQTVTAQLISCCRAHICAAGKLWDQDRPVLVAKLGAAVELRGAYVDAFRCIEKLLDFFK
jgi:hypothetical protein